MSIKASVAAGQKWKGDGEPPQSHRQGESTASWGRTSSHRCDQSWRKTFIHSPLKVSFHVIGISCESLCGSEGATGGVSSWKWIRWIKVDRGRSLCFPLCSWWVSSAASCSAELAPSPQHIPSVSSPPATFCAPGEARWCWNSKTHFHLNYTKRLRKVLQPHSL